MSNYSKQIKVNLEAMGTTVKDWKVVESVTDFPGYLPAPTMYPATSDGDFTSCELCGHKIKRVFSIICDKLKVEMTVGSECVCHFADGKSGERLAKEKVWSANREWLIEQIRKYKALRSIISERKTKGASNFQQVRVSNEVRRHLKKFIIADYEGKEIKNQSITAFVKNNKEAFEKTMNNETPYLTFPPNLWRCL